MKMKSYTLVPDSSGTGELMLSLGEREIPSPGDDEVLVKMASASLNYRDLLMKSGKSASSGSDPVIPFSDGAGLIEAVGSNVTKWSVGDRVALTFFRDWESGAFDMRYHGAARGGSCDGVLAEYVAAPAHSLVKVPHYLSLEEASTLPCAALTAWHGMMERRVPVGVGDTVLCLGTGGVSIFATQIAKAAGARVIVTSSSDEKLERAQKLGADEIINYKKNPDWDKEVYRLTDKKGANHVVEVGGPGTLGKSMNAAAAGGSISLIGVLTGFSPPDASLFPLVTKNVDLQGIYVGSREMFERMNQFLQAHQIHPVIDQSFSFAEASDAYSCLQGAQHLGKLVVRY